MEYRYLKIILIIILSFIVQCTLCPIFRIGVVCPNLVLIVVVLLGTYFGSVRGAIFGILIGLFVDVLASDKLGPYLSTYFLCGILTGFLAKKVYRRHWLSIVFVTIVGSLVEGTMIGLWSGYDEMFITLKILFEGILYNILVCIPLSIVIYNFLTKVKSDTPTSLTPDQEFEV